MASKDTNSTIFTIAFVAAGGFIVWKLFGKGTKTAAASTAGVGGDYPDYYAPQQTQATNPLDGALNAIAAALSGHGSGSASAGKTSGSGVTDAAGSSDPLTNFFNLITNDDQLDAANFDYSGSSVASNAYDSTLSSSDFSIPYEDSNELFSNPGTFIDSSNDGSANAVSNADQYVETQGDDSVYSLPLNDTAPGSGSEPVDGSGYDDSD
jgi:hypothetical protein